MRVSKYYKLKRIQPSLDFFDADVRGDNKVFVDPRALRLLHSDWADECVALVQNFFSQLLTLIHKGANRQARALLEVLKEPNETHLGLSQGEAHGRALGRTSASNVWKALSKSEAVKSGILEDLEDTILMVEGISSDIVSDITTNLIRGPLIKYTQEMASYYGIPLQPQVNSGPLWDPMNQQWDSRLLPMPVTRWGKLLLVPKVIVRRRMDYDAGEYYRHYILEHLRKLEIDANTQLVQLLRDGRTRVTKKDLTNKYGSGKAVIVRETRRHPEILREYRREKSFQLQSPLDHIDIAQTAGSPMPDWDSLILALDTIEPGPVDSTEYENAIESLLTALFYPSLANPQVQRKIHDARKRVDITYTNVASTGFWYWLGQHYPAPHLFVECKNYSWEVGNPELDQLSGRFSPSRGQVGLLVCRRFHDKDLFLKKCRDTAYDTRGFVIALDDSDLRSLVHERRSHPGYLEFALLRERFELLVF